MTFKHLLLAIATVTATASASAIEIKPYTDASFAKAQAEGKSTALHFHADWCPSCKKQAQSLDALKAEKTLDVTVFVANYDLEEPLKKKLGINSQSVFVVFKGNVEKARMAGASSVEAVKAVLTKAL